jgi:hypothetical protein
LKAVCDRPIRYRSQLLAVFRAEEFDYMTRSRVWPLLVAPTLLLALASCGGNDDKSSNLPATAPSSSNTPSSATPSSTPTPTPTAKPTQTTAKYGDLTLVLNRPAAVNPTAEIPVTLFLKMHQLFGGMASGQPTPAELSQIADPAAVKYLNEVLAPERKAKRHSGGTLTVSVTKAQAASVLAVVDGCFNQSKLTTIRADGSHFVDTTVTQDPIFPVRMTLSKSTGIWKISDYVFKEGKC